MALVLCFDALSQADRAAPPRQGNSRDFAAVMAQTGAVATVLAFCPHIQSNRPKAEAIE
jgi:hypothetical protein